MNTKEYLRQIEKLRRQINNDLSEIKRLKELVCSIKAVSNDKESVQSSGSQDRLGDSVARIVDAEADAYRAIENYIKERNRIIAQIESIEDAVLYDILFKRFVQSKTFEEMSDEMSYSMRQILRLYDEAIKNFEEKYGTWHKMS